MECYAFTLCTPNSLKLHLMCIDIKEIRKPLGLSYFVNLQDNKHHLELFLILQIAFNFKTPLVVKINIV